MRVLHYFEQYLSDTMGWAPKLIVRAAGAEHWVASPRMSGTNHRYSHWNFIMPWYQKEPAACSFPLPMGLRVIAKLDQGLGYYSRQVKKTIEYEGLNIIHAHFADAGCRWLSEKKRAGRPLVVSFYGVDYRKLPQMYPELQAQYQTMFQVAAAIICEGPYAAAELQRMGCSAHKIHVVPFGIDPLHIDQHKPRQKPAGRLKLLQAATFTPKKGQLDTVRAFHAALPYCPRATLTFVGEIGDKAYHKSVVGFIRQYQLQGKVVLRDFVPASDFEAFMKSFDAVIQPSHYAPDGDCEGGAPVALLDAQRVGLPLIVSDHCDIPFVVRPDGSALVSAEGDVGALAQHIIAMYNMSPAAYSRMSEEGMRHVHLDFNLSVSGQKLYRVYEAVLSS
jgi:colanic acid/amylovoran biosynthesis glycosyltransferase